MVSWPSRGTRVTVRYRRPPGSVPPLTDAVGHLIEIDPAVRVRTKSGEVVEVSPADVVALRVLTDAPVRTSEIRALEHAAAAAWPGSEHTWVDGWLLRAGFGFAANSAVPLGLSADLGAVPAIVAWYDGRGVTPRLVVPDRLLAVPAGAAIDRTEQILVRELSDASVRESDPAVTLSARPDDAWLGSYRPGDMPVEMLTAVIDGEVAFGAHSGATARAAVTAAPDGTRWVGLSAVRPTGERAAARVCRALLAWGADRGATRGYLRVHRRGAALADSLGFRPHHRRRYFPVPPSGWDSV